MDTRHKRDRHRAADDTLVSIYGYRSDEMLDHRYRTARRWIPISAVYFRTARQMVRDGSAQWGQVEGDGLRLYDDPPAEVTLGVGVVLVGDLRQWAKDAVEAVIKEAAMAKGSRSEREHTPVPAAAGL